MRRWQWAVGVLLGMYAAVSQSSGSLCQQRFDENDVAGTLEACSAAVNANPDDAGSWAYLGRAQLAFEKHEAAMTAFDRALGIDPALVPALIGRAVLHHQLKDADAALQDFAAVLKRQPKHFEALLSIGAIHEEQGRYADAVQFFERAAEVQPDNIEPLLALVEIESSKWASDAPQAPSAPPNDKRLERYLERAVKASATDYRGLQYRGRWRELQKKFAKAEDDYRAAIARAPQEQSLHLDLARVLILQSQTKEALSALDQGLALGPEPNLLLMRLEQRLAAGDVVGALVDQGALQPFKLEGALQQKVRTLVDRAMAEKYASGMTAARTALDDLALSDRSCILPPADSDAAADLFVKHLVEAGGDRQEGRTRVSAALIQQQQSCLTHALPPPTASYAEARQKVNAARAAIAASAQQLEADCAAYPQAQERCAEYAQKYQERGSTMQTVLREREDQAIARRLEVQRRKSELDTLAPLLAAEIEKKFAERAGRVFAEVYDPTQLSRATAYIQDRSVLSAPKSCTAPDIDDVEQGHISADEFNERNRAFVQCIRDADERLSDSAGDYEEASEYLEMVRQHLMGLRSYLCSRSATAQCISDAAWVEAEQRVPAALISEGRSGLQQYRYWLGGGLQQLVDAQQASVTAYNERLAAREAEAERAERMNNFANAMRTFSETLQQENQQGYGGYGGGYDSSTSAPGMR